MAERTMRRETALLSALTALCIGIALDQWSYRHISYPTVYEHDWGRLLRVLGFWPTWGIAALALWCHQRREVKTAARSALLLAGTPAVAGIVAEGLKLVIRRERPDAGRGEYVFRAFSDGPFSSAGIGSPSSHAAVAFGAAAILSMMYPKSRPVWLVLASGCAMTRVLARAHFLSDVVAGAIVGLLAPALIRIASHGRICAARERDEFTHEKLPVP